MPALFVFSGKIDAAPREFASGPGWYHVSCYQGMAPCAVAATEQGLPGGSVLCPGEEYSLYGDSVWVVGPKDGQKSIVTIELRERPSYRSYSPFAFRRSITSWKSSALWHLPEQQWQPLLSNVTGMVGAHVRVSGTGQVWIGTHVDTTRKPWEPVSGVKGETGAFPLLPSDPPIWLEGNPSLYAFAEGPHSYIHVMKIAGGRVFVTNLTPEAA